MVIKAKIGAVVLDSNMLLSIERFKADVFSGINSLLGKVDFCITKAVEKELQGLEKSYKKECNIARQLMEKNSVKTIETEAKKADDSLVECAGQGMIIATNDRELRKRIKGFGGKVIYLKKKKFVEIG